MPNASAVKIATNHLFNRAQAIMTCNTATKFYTKFPSFQIKLIMKYNDLIQRDFIKLRGFFVQTDQIRS